MERDNEGVLQVTTLDVQCLYKGQANMDCESILGHLKVTFDESEASVFD